MQDLQAMIKNSQPNAEADDFENDDEFDNDDDSEDNEKVENVITVGIKEDEAEKSFYNEEAKLHTKNSNDTVEEPMGVSCCCGFW